MAEAEGSQGESFYASAEAGTGEGVEVLADEFYGDVVGGGELVDDVADDIVGEDIEDVGVGRRHRSDCLQMVSVLFIVKDV